MSYSPVMRSVSAKTLRDPMWVAALASLSLHALFWALLPFWPSGSNLTEDEIQEPVELIELSPLEQSRLPDFPEAELSLPTFPDSALTPSIIPPKPPSFSLTPLPNQPPVRLTPTLPPFFVPPPPPLPRATSSFPRSPIISRRSPLVIPSPPSQPTTTPSPSATPTPPAAATPSPTPPAPTETPTGSASDLQDPNATPTPATESPTPTPDGTATQSPSPSGEGSPSPTPSLEEIVASQPELYAYNRRGTSDTDYGGQYSGWFSNAVEWMGDDYNPEDYDPQEAPSREIEVTLPRPGCVANLQNLQQAVVGLLVDEEGQIVDDPTPVLLRSSGYPFLNVQALEAATSLEFEPAGKKQAYRITVTYRRDNEVCTANAPAS